MELIGVHSQSVKIWKTELRLLDHSDFIPDIILELDDQILIIEIQSTKITELFLKRALVYVGIVNRKKKVNKIVNLVVLSTAEESHVEKYPFSENSVFSFRVVNLRDFDENAIITDVEPKIEKNSEIDGKSLVLYALIPMIVEKDRVNYINKVVHNLLRLRNSTISLKSLAFGIEWLIVDKFVDNEEDRNILCDCLGDRMRLIDEYGERKQQKGVIIGMKEILAWFIDNGFSVEAISSMTGKSVDFINDILGS